MTILPAEITVLGFGVVPGAQLVVIDDLASSLVPNLDSELVRSAAAVHLPVHGAQEESIVPAAVDRARASILRARSRNHQPVAGRAVEIHARNMEVELSVPIRHDRAMLILRHESES